MTATTDTVQQRQAAADPTPRQAIVENILAEQQSQLKRQADEIRVLEATRDRLKATLEAMRGEWARTDHQVSVLAGGRDILARHTFEGVVRAITDTEVEISVEMAAATDLLRIAVERFAPGHVLAVGDHVTVDNFCTRAPRTGTSPEVSASVEECDELAGMVEGLRRRSSQGQTQP